MYYMIDKILHNNIIMSKTKKGGGIKETFTGLVDSMEGFVNDNIGKLFNKNGTKKETKKVEKRETKQAKEPVQTNNEDSLDDHHNNYRSLESM